VVYGKTAKKWESAQQLFCHYDLFRRSITLKEAISQRIYFCFSAAPDTGYRNTEVRLIARLRLKCDGTCADERDVILKVCVGLHVKYTLFVSDFNEIGVFLQIFKNSSNAKFTDFQKLLECQIYRFSKTLRISNLQIFKNFSNVKFTDFKKIFECQIYRFSKIPRMSDLQILKKLFEYQIYRFSKTTRMSNLKIFKNSSNVKFTDFKKLFEYQIYRFSKIIRMSNLQIFKNSSNVKFTDFQNFFEYQIYGFSKIPQMSNLQIFRNSSNVKFHEVPFSGRRVVPCGLTDGQIWRS